MNSKNPRSKTGKKGIFKRGESFTVRLCVGGKIIYLGSFHTLEEAEGIYDRAYARYRSY